MTDFDFDLIVIGAGPGGYVAAIRGERRTPHARPYRRGQNRAASKESINSTIRGGRESEWRSGTGRAEPRAAALCEICVMLCS